jgi:hypothetical protein
MKRMVGSIDSQILDFGNSIGGWKMKNLSILWVIVFALYMGANAMVQKARATAGRKTSSIDAELVVSTPYRDGLYLGRLASERGGAPHI